MRESWLKREKREVDGLELMARQKQGGTAASFIDARLAASRTSQGGTKRNTKARRDPSYPSQTSSLPITNPSPVRVRRLEYGLHAGGTPDTARPVCRAHPVRPIHPVKRPQPGHVTGRLSLVCPRQFASLRCKGTACLWFKSP